MRNLSFDPLWKKLIDLKMTKTELAERTGISRTTISKMGKDEPVGLIGRNPQDLPGSGLWD